MAYPRVPNYTRLIEEIGFLVQKKHEHGAKGMNGPLAKAEKALKLAYQELERLPVDSKQAAKEPNDLESIHALRPKGLRRLWEQFDSKLYAEKVEGAMLARFAGCTLGTLVEGWSIDFTSSWAKEIGNPFPPVDYWTEARTPSESRQGINTCREYTRDGLNGVPVDDDTIYTLLGLLMLEEYGPDFTTANVGDMWHTYLPWCWDDMKWPLDRYIAGIPAEKAADHNPYSEMICAFIRCDPYGYAAPGQPEKAAALSYKDGLMSHRRNGLFGGMFFAATIAAAFAVDDPVDAIRIGLTEIPQHSRLAKEIRWALSLENSIKDYRDARNAVDERLAGMFQVHTINNACLVTFGLMLGRRDVTKVLSQTLAMGLDNDCTTATAGSIVGAVVGKSGIPEHWYRNFNNTVHSYIKGHRRFKITDLVKRYNRQAKRVWDWG